MRGEASASSRSVNLVRSVQNKATIVLKAAAALPLRNVRSNAISRTNQLFANRVTSQ